MSMIVATIVALGAAAQAAPVVVTADRPMEEKVEQPVDFAPRLNRAAALVVQGDYEQARSIYQAIEAMHAEYKLETTDGRWLYPAEIARRGMLAIERRSAPVVLAAR